MQFELLNTCIA